MSVRRWPVAAALSAVLVLLGGLAYALVHVTREADADPIAPTKATAQATETPTPSPADAELAAMLAEEGKVEAAIGAYESVVTQGTTEERVAAHVPLARALLEDGRVEAAVDQLDAYLIEAPAGSDVRDAQFLLAEALGARGEWRSAVPLYDAYIAEGGGAALYARIGRAEALARLGSTEDAAHEAELILEEALPAAERLRFTLAMAQALEAPDGEEALAWYERLRAESASPGDHALAIWRSAVIEEDLGEAGATAEAWATVVIGFPESPTAQQIVDDAPAGAPLLDGFYTGLVYFRAGRDGEARVAFERSLRENGSGDDDADLSLAARSSFYLAVLLERGDDVDRALDAYARVLELDADVDVADDALWWRGRLLESDGRLVVAAQSYRRLVSTFEDSEYAVAARFRLGLLDYDAGRFDDAADAFDAITDTTREEERRWALLWQGKALAGAGDDEGAASIWRSLVDDAPESFAGLRAAVLLGEASGELEDAGLDEAPELDWGAIETWLSDVSGGDLAAAQERVLLDAHWSLGRELAALGMEERASNEFALLLDEASNAPAVLYRLTRSFREEGLPDLSSRAATRLLRALPADVRREAPVDLWRLAYPAAYLEELRAAVDETAVPDLLLLALVRQESFFDRLAGSTAGALGLTQVIPPTGEAIAKQLGMESFETEDLFRADVSLRFGAAYLSEQLETFDGDVYRALAAYNAGPANAKRWSSAAGDDVDRFVAEIDFAQTRAYVRLVSENLARYRQVYQDLEAPALPEE